MTKNLANEKAEAKSKQNLLSNVVDPQMCLLETDPRIRKPELGIQIRIQPRHFCGNGKIVK
jgi:hypothetical protein